jgi:hypothetical protein
MTWTTMSTWWYTNASILGAKWPQRRHQLFVEYDAAMTHLLVLRVLGADDVEVSLPIRSTKSLASPRVSQNR